LSSGVGECVVKHSPDYVRRRFVAGRENALLRTVFTHLRYRHRLIIPVAALISSLV
jgi:hypothetical protein